MGVMPCSRRGCENIMCDRYSHKYGHICDECFQELVSRGRDQSIAEFLYEMKGDICMDQYDALNRFDSEFPHRGR